MKPQHQSHIDDELGRNVLVICVAGGLAIQRW
jgi:hypothetical protein